MHHSSHRAQKQKSLLTSKQESQAASMDALLRRAAQTYVQEVAFILLDLFPDVLVEEQLAQDEGAHGLHVQTLRLGQDLLHSTIDGRVLLPLLRVRTFLVQLQRLKVSSQEHHTRPEAAHFHKVVEQVHPLLQRLLQVVAQRQVLGVVADFLHAAPLRLLRGLLCPVLVFIIAILRPRQEEGKVNLEITVIISRLFDVGLLDCKD